MLAKKLKVQPKKPRKRGALRKTKTGKKSVVLKTVKPKKRVSFAKKPMFGKLQVQEEARYKGRTAYGEKPTTYGSAGDPVAPLQPRMVQNPNTGK